MKKADSFDNDTLVSLARSLMLTAVSALGVFMVAIAQGIKTEEAILVALGTLGSFLVNIPIQYKRGESKTDS